MDVQFMFPLKQTRLGKRQYACRANQSWTTPATTKGETSMNSKKWITGIGVLALGATLAIAAPQEGKGFGGGHHGQRGIMSERLAQKLNLTDAQKQQVKTLNQQFREENKAFFQSVRQTRQEARAAKEANDTAKLDALKPTIDSQRAQMKQLRDAQESKVLSILTPDQQSQYRALKAEWAAKRAQKQGQR
jgi:periplasmic protein CpxP/Spy